MIDKKTIKIICAEFDLGYMADFQAVLEGAVNEKYKITTDKGNFFLKIVKDKPDEHLSYVSDIESYMQSKGIPAVAMMSARDGSKWIRSDDTQYTVYPYIEGDKSKKYSLQQYETMGTLLGKMHKAGEEGVPFILFRNAYTKLSKEDGLLFSNEKRDEIISWGTLEEDDKKFLEYLEYKINLIPNMDEGSTHAHDTVIHSDFHRDNIIFHPETKEIIGICDWERGHLGSRVSDIARSIICCFSRGYVYEVAIENAKAMLAGYMKEYPITREELQNGFYAHACLVTFVPWMEERYYNKGKKDAVDFIEHERGVVKLCIEGKLLNDLMV